LGSADPNFTGILHKHTFFHARNPTQKAVNQLEQLLRDALTGRVDALDVRVDAAVHSVRRRRDKAGHGVRFAVPSGGVENAARVELVHVEDPLQVVDAGRQVVAKHLGNGRNGHVLVKLLLAGRPDANVLEAALQVVEAVPSRSLGLRILSEPVGLRQDATGIGRCTNG